MTTFRDAADAHRTSGGDLTVDAGQAAARELFPDFDDRSNADQDFLTELAVNWIEEDEAAESAQDNDRNGMW